MRSRLWFGLLLLPALVLPVLPAVALDKPSPTPVGWKKTVIDTKFRSEGVAIADVNKDGKTDILTGEWWFEAPDWKPHAIRKAPEDYTRGDQNVYSQSFCCWTEDYNGDGWTDLLVIRFPGQPCYWYENPRGGTGFWKEHMVWDNACNETPQYVDLFGKGQRVLVMGIQPRGQGDGNAGQMVWLRPGKDPNQLWEVHPISEPSNPAAKRIIPGTFKYSHGLGIGDVNSDGRNDVICTDGWWEQPAKDEGKPWKFHPARLGEAAADMFAYDMDGDGRSDIISSSAHKFGIWWHQQTGSRDEPTFARHDLFRELVSETHAMHCVDMNGDGLKDLVTGKRYWSHGRAEPGSDWPAMLYWFEASRDKAGKVKFTPRIIDIDSGVGTQFVVDDFNGDKLLDVVVSNKQGTFLFEQVRAPQARAAK